MAENISNQFFQNISTISPKTDITTLTMIFLYTTVVIFIIVIFLLLYKLFGKVFKKLRRNGLPDDEPVIHYNIEDLPGDEEESNEEFRPAHDLRAFGFWPVPRHERFWPLGNEAGSALPREAGGGDNHLRRLPNSYIAPSSQRLTGRGDMNIMPVDPAIGNRHPRAQLRIRPQYRRHLER